MSMVHHVEHEHVKSKLREVEAANHTLRERIAVDISTAIDRDAEIASLKNKLAILAEQYATYREAVGASLAGQQEDVCRCLSQNDSPPGSHHERSCNRYRESTCL